MGLARELVKKVKEELEQKKASRQALLNRLALVDADLDLMDELIVSLDKKSSTIIDSLNQKINIVRDAYNARVSANCRSNLVWQNIGSFRSVGNLSGGLTIIDYSIYKAVVDNSGEEIIPYYGLKYTQKPLDRDYGSSIISQFTGTVEDGKPLIIVTDDSGISPEIQIGNVITDSLSSPQIFNLADLPTVTGFGFTEGISEVGTLVGGISTNSNVFYHFGAGDFNIVEEGMNFSLPNTSIIPPSTEVVGFGTGDWPIEYFDENGDLQTSILTVNTIILSNPATEYVEESSFSVGIVTNYPAIMISTSASSNRTNVPFIALSVDSNLDSNFDYTSNPNSPLKIGILGPGDVGIGGSISLDISGNPSESKVWNPGSTYVDPTLNEEKCLLRNDSRWENGQCIINPEPIVGSGKPNYAIGEEAWPIVKFGVAPFYQFRYAEEGDTIRVSGGGIQFGYTSTPPSPQPSPQQCAQLTEQINNALAEYEEEKNKIGGKIEEYAAISQALRVERERKQMYAWSLLQGSSKLLEEINQTEKFINQIDTFDFEELN